MSITALTGEALEDLGAVNFYDYARTVPGVSFTPANPVGERNGLVIRIRGVASAGSVGYYVDETPVVATDLNLFDINRIEILRGPQGTLYGANSLIGLIKIVPNVPELGETGGSFLGTISATDEGGINAQANVMANIPLSENAAIRAVAYRIRNSGYIDTVPLAGTTVTSVTVPEPRRAFFDGAGKLGKNANQDDISGFRVTARWQPVSNLDLRAQVIHEEKFVAQDGWADKPLSNLTALTGIATPRSEDVWLYNFNGSYDFGWGELTSSTSWFSRKYGERYEMRRFFQKTFGVDLTDAFMDTGVDDERFTQELRLSSTLGKNLRWQLGAFYYKNTRHFDQTFIPDSFDEAFGRQIYPGNIFFLANRLDHEKEVAVFGEATYSVTDKLEVTVGLRWFELEQNRLRREDGFFNGGPVTLNSSLKETGNFNPKFFAKYDITPDHMVYGQVSKGFRAGGMNGNIPLGPCGADLAKLGLTAAPKSFGSDTLWNYEVGAKTSWFNRKLAVNASAYFIDWSGIPQQIALACGFQFIDNVGAASSRGFELELRAQPFEGFELNVATGYSDAKLEKDAPALKGKKGDPLQDVPDWTLAVGAAYSFPVSSSVNGWIRGDYQYVGERFRDFIFTNPDGRYPGYDVVNLRAGFQTGQYEMSFFINNLMNKTPILQMVVPFLGADMPLEGRTLRPRTIGVNLKANF